MALLIVNQEDLYHFSSADDIALWLERNPSTDVILIDDEMDGEVTDLLYDYYPLTFTTK